MIVLVAGLPAAHFNRIQERAPRIFGPGNPFISTSLRPDRDGEYRPNADHGERLVEILTKRVRENTKLLDRGVGVLVLAQPGYDPTACMESFRPFALTAIATLSPTVHTEGRRGEMTGNEIADALGAAFQPLVRAVGAINTEVATRLNRTPLLLPLRNFASDLLVPTVADLWQQLPASEDPGSVIATACRKIEAAHPYSKIGGSNRRCFEDAKSIQFRSPARAHHGMAASADPPHNCRCFLNGNLRLGGRITNGFHYDCIRDFSEGRRELPLSGTFPNCHNGKDDLKGHPHINIAPNDFCRV